MNLLVGFDQETPYATEFRRLLQNLNGAISDKQSKMILVTSAMLSEGKSTVVSHLAITAACQKGKKTLLVDCDLRRPTLHRLFGQERENGLVEAVVDKCKPNDVIKKTTEPKLHILTAGRSVAKPTEIFESGGVFKLLEEIRFYYELILIDCAPILPVSDPMLLAGAVDGVLMVLKAGSTQKEVAQRATRLLKDSNANLLGVVLNNLDNALPYYYNESFYGYDYRPQKQ